MGKLEVISTKGKKPIKFHKNGLHESTHTAIGTKIPEAKIEKALSGGFGSKAKKQANFMKNVLHK